MLSYVISLTLLSIAVIILRGIFKNKMSSRLVYGLWLAVLIRMVLPFDVIQIDSVGVDYIGALESAAGHEIVLMWDDKTENLNFQAETELGVNSPIEDKDPIGDKEPIFNSGNIGGSETGEQGIDSIQSDNNFISDVSTDKAETGIGSMIDSSSLAESQEGNKEPVEVDSADKPSYETPEASQNEAVNKPSTETFTQDILNETNENITVSVKDILNAVWLVGALVTASVFVISWIVFSIRLGRSRTFLTKAGKIKVYVSDRIVSPFVCGIIPKIYVTPEASESEAFSNVILHEKVHVAHGDVIWNLIRICAVSVFWYNPVIWVAAILSKRDSEFACDEAVAMKLEGTSKLEYAKMIVAMTPVKKNYVVNFAGGPIKERVVRLTNKHKNKVIVAVIAVLLAAVCIVVAFIGISHVSGNPDETDGTNSAQREETTEPKEENKDPNTDSEKTEEELGEVSLIYEKFNVYSVEDYGEERLEGLKVYDKSSSENSFKFVLEAKEDDVSAWLTYLNWHDNTYVEKELQTTLISTLKKGEACVICVDVYEPVSRVGLQCQFDRVFYRACPVLDANGKPKLESIDNRLGPAFHLYGKVYPVTVGGTDSLQNQLDKLFENSEFAEHNSKMLEVRGLSKEFYFSLSYEDLRGAWLDMESYELVSECDKAELDNLKTEIYEWNGFIVLSRSSYEVGDTWFFRDGQVIEFHPDGDTSVTFSFNEKGEMKYTRFAKRFNGRIHEDMSTVLEIAVSRDEFLREIGSVSVDADGKIVLTPEKTYTVSDVYDLDATFERYREADYFKRKYPNCKSADEVLTANSALEALRNVGKNDIRYKWVAAFLGRDAETLIGMTRLGTSESADEAVAVKERMSNYLQTMLDNIVVGDYTVVHPSGDGDIPMQFDFEIISSTVEEFPAGEYSVVLSGNGTFTSPGVYFTRRPNVTALADEDEAFFAERMFDSWYGDLDYPQAVGSYASLALFYLYERANGLEYKGNTKLTKTELENIASEIYEEGFEINYWSFDYHEGEGGEEGYYTVRGMGGTVKYYDVISRVENDGVITYDVVYYAEPMKLIPAKVFRYTARRSDSVYGFKLVGVEMIKNTGFEIFTQGM